MILLKLKNDKVVGIIDVSPTYQPKYNEIEVDSLPPVELKENERAYIYYRNGQIEYEKEIKE